MSTEDNNSEFRELEFRDAEFKDADLKWYTRAALLPAVAFLGFSAAVIVGVGAVVVGGLVAMSPEQKAEIVKQTADAIPAIVIGSVGLVTGIVTFGGALTFLANRREARREAREQQLPPRRNS